LRLFKRPSRRYHRSFSRPLVSEAAEAAMDVQEAAEAMDALEVMAAALAMVAEVMVAEAPMVEVAMAAEVMEAEALTVQEAMEAAPARMAAVLLRMVLAITHRLHRAMVVVDMLVTHQALLRTQRVVAIQATQLTLPLLVS
jgi:hypothetical protein